MTDSLIISDMHLCEAIPGEGLWLKYRQQKYFPDQDFADFITEIERRVGAEGYELIFNGDLFDFDAPSIINGKESFHSAPGTEGAAVDAIRRIIADHHLFISELGALLARGRRIVFISGNHDVQLTFPMVRLLLTEVLLQAARTAGAMQDEQSLKAQLIFRSWFYTSETGLHVEHGNQYDKYCSFRYPTEPFTADGKRIQPTFGSLTHTHLASRLGYVNPHVDSSFMLTLPQYIQHWFRYYFFTRRSPLAICLVGTARTLGTTWALRSCPDEHRNYRMLLASAAETGADTKQLSAHASLFVAPAEDDLHTVMRELWLDRVLLVVCGIMATVIADYFGTAWMLATGGVAVVAIVLYEALVPKPPLDNIYRHVDASARQAAAIHGTKGAVFGHTHQPFGMWEKGLFFGNSGTWSASFKDVECTIPLTDGKPVIWIRSTPDGEIEGGLYSWRNGELVAPE